ncbi:DUF5686 and carboxypeptidase regulatory-like domain-containing protein [Mucilaginibacter sp. SMC90]|uniref:DUF5686 and carboxypeptidase regulatory-like domain-containing protein n=1 Tax=Mucilaginibacter sp. SMC90 TaxID=2929803 RepID=UPI001FB231B7|nr:DUF5686 and carboxypeptidase regulatory-like domain-containing protein [Mucilaginibacter sp. SMC90]UOE50515.1 DUF5686 and carboxypeptidase regulatory-like domain-containing protein [Mucilaginibacter sp. SMC90]
MRKYILLFIIAFSAITASAQQSLLTGKITDKNGQVIPFVSIYIRNSTYGTTANENGVYQFKLSPGTYNVIYRYVGYTEKIEQITIADHDQEHNVQMADEVFNTDRVSETYLKNRDVADTIIKQVIKKRKYYTEEATSFSCAVYIKGVQKLLSVPKSLIGHEVQRTLDLDSNGRGILYQSESLSEYNFQKPDKIKEITIANRMAGQNTAFGYKKASDLQANFYENVITIPGLASRGFVSPVAAYGPRFYNYKLLGTSVENGRTVDKIRVIPKRNHGQYFQGDIYIVENDWRIYSVDFFVDNKVSNLNLVDTLSIRQQYIAITDSVWMPASTQYNFKGAVLGFKFGGYYAAVYNNYKINPTFPDGFFTGEILKVDTVANSKKPNYWADARPIPLTAFEERDYKKKDAFEEYKKTDRYIDSLQHRKNRINYPGYLIFGYAASNKSARDSLYIFPFIQTFYYNTVEGFGINAKASYIRTIDDLHSLTITPALRYGFSNKIFSANVATEYLNDPFHAAKFYADFGSDVLDLNNVGTRSLYFNTLSTLLSENNYVKYYRSHYGDFGYQREVTNGVLLKGGFSYSSRSQLYNTSFSKLKDVKDREFTSNNPLAPPGTPPDDHSFLFPDNQALVFNVSALFTFDQRYETRPTGKFNLPSKYPMVKINYRKGFKSILGSDVDYDFASVDISQDHIQTGLSGYSSFKVSGGGFFNNNKLYYMDYNHFLGNQGTTFDPTYVGSFHFLPFYTYSTNGAFLEAHYQHNFAGSLFNHISFLRKAKLEEIIGANYLTTKNNRNYREFYIGVQRLIFRVDYGISYAGDKKYIQGFRIFYGIR